MTKEELAKRAYKNMAVTVEFANWWTKEQRRVDHEWDRWDGTEEQGMQINDAQCARIWAARARMVNNGVVA